MSRKSLFSFPQFCSLTAVPLPLRIMIAHLFYHSTKSLEQIQNGEIECRDYYEVLKELANHQIEFYLENVADANYTNFEGAVAIMYFVFYKFIL